MGDLKKLMNKKIQNYLKKGINLRKKTFNLENKIEKAADITASCLENNGKILLCGNGGSAADSQHIAAEFVNKFYQDRKGLPAIALTTDSSIITAVGNDYQYDKIFEKQIDALGKPNDVLMAISTSGNSRNVIKALEKAKKMNINTIGLTGKDGAKMKNLVDLLIDVPSEDTPQIQEIHLTVEHLICLLVEKNIFG